MAPWCCFQADAPRIAALIEETAVVVPASRPALVRTIVESIAHAFATAVATAGRLTGREIDVVHIVGGGALNRLLLPGTGAAQARLIVRRRRPVSTSRPGAPR